MASGLLTPDARLRVVSDVGVILPGAKLNTYVAGTSTPLATYSDSALTTPNANPVVASAGGLFGPIYLTKGVAYKFVLTDTLGGAVWTQDNVSTPTDNTLAAGTGISLNTVAGVTTITNTVAAVVAPIATNNFRLTLESGVPVSATDQLAKTTLFCAPYNGNRIDLYDASGVPTTVSSAQVSIAIPASTSQVYDVFGFSNAGVFTLELLAWTNDTTRATAIVQTTTGAWTKTGDLTRRYLGSVRTTTVNGQTEDSLVKRYVWNVSNRVRRVLRRMETTASWTYSLAALHQANAAAANQVDLVVGLADVALHLDLAVHAANTTGTSIGVYIGIGQDSTAAVVAGQLGGEAYPPSTGLVGLRASLDLLPAVGRHFYAWLEYATATGTTTWYGTNLATLTAGLSGFYEG